MKPVYLEFCGINSFSEKAQIDFKALLSGGVFGIFGDTGSGKSTILDSIHFALYGEIDRAPKSFGECINHKSEKAYVSFDFELVNDGVRKTYRVQRERKLKAGSTKAYLYEQTPTGEWLALAEGARDVDEKVEKIIGLTFADFKMCIALPQGDFAALVKSTQAERVKLVARLFNLEQYGERLAKAVNEKYYRADEEVRLLEAKLEENVDGEEGSVEALQTQISERKAALVSLQNVAEQANEIHRLALAQQKEKQQFDDLKLRLDGYESKLGEMQKKRAVIQRLPLAKRVTEKSEALQMNAQGEAVAIQNAQRAQAQREQMLALYTVGKDNLEKADYESLILQTTMDLDKVRAAQEDMLAEQRAKRELDECIAAYSQLNNACPKEDFEEQKSVLEAQITALGEDGSLLDFINRHYKDTVLIEAREEFRQDLRGLQTRFPQTNEAVEELLQKYADGENVAQDLDVLKLQDAFKKADAERKALKTKLDGLEKRYRAYQLNEEKKALLAEQGKLLRQNHLIAAEKTKAVKALGSAEALQQRLDGYKSSQRQAQQHLESLQEKANALFAEWQKQDGLRGVYAQNKTELEKDLKTSLEESGFDSVSEAAALIAAYGDGQRLQTECEQFFERYNATRLQYESVDKTKFENYDANVLEHALQEKMRLQAEVSACLQLLGGEENKLKRLLELQEKYKALTQELQEKQKRRALCDELRTLLKSNRFLEFIACEYLQEICVSASQKLLSLTGGRYFLQYEKEFKVGDNLDGGNLRAVKTLSGGETFLVSLSLALSLSGAICQKSLRPIEFFFLDEGFGTLDDKLVDTVMDVLGKLSKSFAVGLISHVEELKHRIDNKILVTGANEQHGSRVQVECF